MEGESVERLMETLLQMRINLRQIAETFQQQTVEIRQQLVVVFEEEKRALDQCLSGIDAKLAECSAQLQHYQRLYASLSSMQQKLAMLGADTACLPAPWPAEQLDGIIAWRLRSLKEQGKI